MNTTVKTASGIEPAKYIDHVIQIMFAMVTSTEQFLFQMVKAIYIIGVPVWWLQWVEQLHQTILFCEVLNSHGFVHLDIIRYGDNLLCLFQDILC